MILKLRFERTCIPVRVAACPDATADAPMMSPSDSQAYLACSRGVKARANENATSLEVTGLPSEKRALAETEKI